MALDYYKMIQEKRGEFSDLFARMDKVKDLYYLKGYKMKGEGDREIPDIENVTLNDPRVFGDRVLAIMAGANRQTEVSGEGLEDKFTTNVEDGLKAIDLAIDERLSRMGVVSGLDAAIRGQLVLRGRSVVRCLVRTEKGELVWDIMPFDSKYSTYEEGKDGEKWREVLTTRTKQQLLNEYPDCGATGSLDVTDYWDDEKNIIFLANRLYKEQKHRYGEVPFVGEKNASGVFMRDADYFQYEGESPFAANLALYEKKNQMMSIFQTLTVASFFAALMYKSEKGENAERPVVPPWRLRAILPVEKDGGYEPMPVNDIREATRLGYSILDSAIQQGSFPTSEYGSLDFPLSAVALVELGQGKDQIILPMLQAWALLRQRLSRMVIKQFINLKTAAEIGEDGFKVKYSAKDFKGDYSIKYKFFSKTPKENIANVSVASAYGTLISDDTKRRDILKLEDPTGEENKILSELADKMVPELALYKMAKAKLDEDPPDEVGAKLIASKLRLTIKQIKSGQIENLLNQPEAAGAQPEQIVPLLGKGAESRAQRKAQPQNLPKA